GPAWPARERVAGPALPRPRAAGKGIYWTRATLRGLESRIPADPHHSKPGSRRPREKTASIDPCRGAAVPCRVRICAEGAAGCPEGHRSGVVFHRRPAGKGRAHHQLRLRRGALSLLEREEQGAVRVEPR